MRRITELLCKRQHWWGQAQDADKTYKKLQDDRKRADLRNPEFASVEDMFDKQLSKLDYTRTKCTERINGLDQEIGTSLLSLFDRNRYSSPGPTTPAASAAPAPPPPSAHQAQDVKIDGSASEKTTLALLRSEMQLEINILKKEMQSQHDSETKQLKKSLDEQTQKTQLLEKKLENTVKEIESDRAHREKRLATVEAKLIVSSANLNSIRGTTDTHMDQIRIMSSDFVHSKKRADEIEARHKASAANHLGAMNNVRDSMKRVEQEMKWRADAIDAKLTASAATLNKRMTDLSSKIPEKSELDIQYAHVKDIMEKQTQEISSALAEIRSLKDQFSQQCLASESAQRKVQSIETRIDSIKVNSESMGTEKFNEEFQKLKDQFAFYDITIEEYKENQEKRDLFQNSLQNKISEMQSEYKKLVPDLKRMKHEGDVAGHNAMNKLEEFKTAVKALEPWMQEFQTAKGDLESLIQQSRIPEKPLMASQQNKEICTPGPSPTIKTDGGGPHASTADLRAVTAQMEKFKGDITTQVAKAIADTQLQLSKNGTVMGKFLDKEREARDATDVNVMDLGEKLASMTQTVETIKTSQVESATTLHNQMNRHAHEIESQRKEVDVARYEARQALGGIEGLQFQLSYLNSWRINFSSKALYKQIVDHIMATMPDDFPAQVRSMAERLNTLEAQHNEQSSKKRKIHNGTAMAVNGQR